MNYVYVMSQETFLCGLRSWSNCVIDIHQSYESAEIEVIDYINKEYVYYKNFKQKSMTIYHELSDKSPNGYIAEYEKWFGLKTCIVKIHKQKVNTRHR